LDTIESTRITISEDEAVLLYPKIKEFVFRNNGTKPDIMSQDPLERRLAEALLYLQRKKREEAQK
jgi:hypothetical protein